MKYPPKGLSANETNSRFKQYNSEQNDIYAGTRKDRQMSLGLKLPGRNTNRPNLGDPGTLPNGRQQAKQSGQLSTCCNALGPI
jgi:hypothetical protein